jgi:hypothetical protein
VASASGAVEHKDVILALLSVSAGLVGLVLIFLGLVVTTYRSYVGDTPPHVLARFRRSAVLILATFAIGVACVLLATSWLITRSDNQTLYRLTIGVFWAQMAALLVAGGWSAWQLIWRT